MIIQACVQGAGTVEAVKSGGGIGGGAGAAHDSAQDAMREGTAV